MNTFIRQKQTMRTGTTDIYKERITIKHSEKKHNNKHSWWLADRT